MNELVSVNKKVDMKKKKSKKMNFDDDLSSDQCIYRTIEVEQI